MCQTVKTAMVLGYMLTTRERITFANLSKVQTRIHNVSEDIFIDISEHDLLQVVEDYPRRFKIERKNNLFEIHVREKFDINFLDDCYRPFFPEKEFCEIKKILLDS